MSRRRKRRRRKNMIAGAVFFCVVVAAFSLAGRASRALEYMETAAETGEAQKTAEKSDAKAGSAETETVGVVSASEENAETGSQKISAERLSRARQTAIEQGYPQSVIDLLDKNPETVEFVENYGSYMAAGQINGSDFSDESSKSDGNASSNKNGLSKRKRETSGVGASAAKGTKNAASTQETLTEGEIPLYIQWDAHWGYHSFGTSVIGVSGCGSTCMAMVIAGLTGDATVTPAVVAEYEEDNGYLDADNNTYWSFMREGGEKWGISAEQGMLTETEAAAELGEGHPIICSMGPGDFTDQGHFIVLTDYEDGNVSVNDPFSRANSAKTWAFAEIEDQIKNMWVYQLD